MCISQIMVNILTIDATILTDSEKRGYYYIMAGMLLVIWASRRFGRKNKR